MSSRELREKMSRDPLVDSINWMRKTWSQHGGKLTWGVGAFLVAYFGVNFYLNQRRSREDQASTLWDVAHEDYINSWGEEGEKKTQLETSAIAAVRNLVETFPGTPQAVHGLLLKADILYRQGAYEEALADYRAALAQAKAEESIIMSRLGIAQCRANVEGATAAIEDLQGILTDYPATAFADQVHFQLANLYESIDDPEQALRHYDQIHEDSAFLDDQTKRRLELLRAPVVRFPEPSA